MATNQYLAWAPSGVAGTNVYSAEAYAALTARTLGVVPGIADPLQANTAWRQATVGVAALAQFCVDTTGSNANDDGSVANFETLLQNALTAYIKSTLAGGIPIRSLKTTVSIASNAANIDWSLGNYFVILLNSALNTLT